MTPTERAAKVAEITHRRDELGELAWGAPVSALECHTGYTALLAIVAELEAELLAGEQAAESRLVDRLAREGAEGFFADYPALFAPRKQQAVP